MFKAIALTVCAAAPMLAAGGAITQAERDYLLEQLETSKKNMLASIDGLTQAQWTFKPAPNVWSVQECAEHIILAEDFLFKNFFEQTLKTPAVERPASSNAEMDRKLVAMIQNRSVKATAPEPLVPSDKFPTPADAAREFTARRDKTIAVAKSTNEDLRTHAMKGPLGTMDAYQALLFIASHSARHTAQIQEVKANKDFPKGESSQ